MGVSNKSAVGTRAPPPQNLRRWGRTALGVLGVVTESHAIGMTISNLDHLAVNQLYARPSYRRRNRTDVNGVGSTGAKPTIQGRLSLGLTDAN